MSLRTRLLLAFAAVVFIPIAVLAFGVRYEMTGRLSDEYERRLDTVLQVIHDDLARESAAIQDRLVSLTSALQNDNRFRAGAVAGLELERQYVIDYAGTAMRLTGLSMLQIQDEEGRIISSGHFRNEHGRLEPGLGEAMRRMRGGVTLATVRMADRDVLALARGESFGLGGRMFTVVGGVAVDEAFLDRLVRDGTTVVALRHPGGVLFSATRPQDRASLDNPGHADTSVREIALSLIRAGAGAPIETSEARLIVMQPLTPLHALLRSADAWFLTTAAAAGLCALLLAVWVSSRISRPLATLAEKTAVLDLDRLDVEFDEDTDEVGHLSRLLGDLAARLRTSTAHVREAERRATIGDLARQINHDIKNGLIPLRNVLRHVMQVGRETPDALPAVLAERRQTIDSSIAYLETLATNYERLSRPADRRGCDLNALVTDVVRGGRGHGHADVRTHLALNLPRLVADPVAVRRILENLLANAVDSLGSEPGRVTMTTERIDVDGELPAIRLTVADTGCGMSPDEMARIFTDFYTTKTHGTGLGLSIVRRLVMDLQGTLRVESEPGVGTRMIIDMPAGAAGSRPMGSSQAAPV